jgi:MFS family permease
MNRSFAVGWRQAFAMMMIMICTGMVASTYGIIAVPLAREFHSSRMTVMLAMTVMSVSTAILSPIVGGLLDRTSLRRIVALGLAGLVGGYLALSFVTSFTHVLVIFGLLFAGSQAMSGPIAGTVLLTRWFERRRGTALGIAVSGIAGGAIVFPPLIQFLLDTFAWREGLRVLALILLVCTTPAWLLLVNRPGDRGLHADGADAPPQTATAAGPGPVPSTREILGDPSFWLLGVVVTTVFAGMMGVITNLVPMARDLGVAANPAAFVVTVYAATGFIGKLGFAALGDRFNPRTLMFAVLALFGIGMACLTQAGAGYGVLLLGAGLVGIGGMMIPLQSFVTPLVFGPEVVGRASGLLRFVSLCGLLVTPPLFGFVFDRTGSYAAIFLAVAGLAAVAMLLVPKIRLHPRGGPPVERVSSQPLVAQANI